MSLQGGGEPGGCMSELRLIFFRAVIYCGIVLSRIRRLQPCQRSKRGRQEAEGGPLCPLLSFSLYEFGPLQQRRD